MKVFDFSALKGIDAQAGLKYSEREETYAQVLGDFHHFIEKNAAAIEKAAAEHSLEDYVREVHKLKSSARLIGAAELSALALRLEMSGRDGELAVIDNETPELLRQYRAFIAVLQPFEKEKPTASGEEMPAAELKTELESLKAKLSAFDYDGAMDIISRLDARVLPAGVMADYNAMRDSTESFEFEDAENYVNRMLGE